MQYNFLNQLMQLYGIGQPLTNQMLKFSGNQFGPQAFEQQQFGGEPSGQRAGFRPQEPINQPAFQAPQVPQTPNVPQANPVQPTFAPSTRTPQQNVFNQFLNQPRMSNGQGDFGGGATGPDSGFYRGGTGG